MSLRDHSGILTAAAVTCALAAWPAPARAQSDYDEDRHALVLYAHGGAFSLSRISTTRTTRSSRADSCWAAVPPIASTASSLSAAISPSRAEARDAGPRPLSPIAGDTFNRFIYDGDVQLRYPLGDGMTPYVFGGGGGITVQRDVARNRSAFTQGAGKVGAGLSYQLPDSDVGIYVEGAGWIYKWDGYGFDNVQFDTTLSCGISYRFHF